MTQNEALNILKTGANVFLTGEPGAGKTHTINRYIVYLRECGIEPAITASTGIAATHVHGMTLHAWSGIGIKRDLTEEDVDRISQNERVAKRMGKAKVLIVDEVSMLDGRTLESVERVCRAVRYSEAPFGGLQVIFVGDFFQLPPVARGAERAVFAYESRAWASLDPLVCYLSEQYRQDDADFLSVLSAIRTDTFDELHAEHLRRRVGEHHTADLDIPRLFPHNADVDRINADRLSRINAPSECFAMTSAGPDGLVENLKRGCLSPEQLELKLGAAVMFTKNSMTGEYVNGTLGTVIDFEEETKFPLIKTHSGGRVTATPAEWAIEENGKVRAKITQIPLRLAWAMTVHKSQGMSIDAAVIDLAHAFEYGQGYVALSRVRRLSGLHLLGFNAQALRVHPDVLERDALFRERSDAAVKAFDEMKEEEVKKLQENFIHALGGKLPKNGKEGTRSKSAFSPEIAHDKTLFEELKKLRRRLADERTSPAFTIFGDATLKEMATIIRSVSNHSRRSRGSVRQNSSNTERYLSKRSVHMQNLVRSKNKEGRREKADPNTPNCPDCPTSPLLPISKPANSFRRNVLSLRSRRRGVFPRERSSHISKSFTHPIPSSLSTIFSPTKNASRSYTKHLRKQKTSHSLPSVSASAKIFPTTNCASRGWCSGNKKKLLAQRNSCTIFFLD